MEEVIKMKERLWLLHALFCPYLIKDYNGNLYCLHKDGENICSRDKCPKLRLRR